LSFREAVASIPSINGVRSEIVDSILNERLAILD